MTKDFIRSVVHDAEGEFKALVYLVELQTSRMCAFLNEKGAGADPALSIQAEIESFPYNGVDKHYVTTLAIRAQFGKT